MCSCANLTALLGIQNYFGSSKRQREERFYDQLMMETQTMENKQQIYDDSDDDTFARNLCQMQLLNPPVRLDCESCSLRLTG